MALNFEFDADTLSDLRKAVLDEATGAGLPGDRASDVVLAVHELAANTVRHGAGAGVVSMAVMGSQLRCQVSEAGAERIDGQAVRTVTAARPWPVRPGHGLWLVQAAADQVTMADGSAGRCVTALFDLPD
ncbi:MAG TPA: ATP-binding protein [Trebonia sp.]|nr:ATP-binding protein [Trebonia sp.]